jgi:hypothetical protein
MIFTGVWYAFQVVYASCRQKASVTKMIADSAAAVDKLLVLEDY